MSEHILSLSYGKDSLACLGAIEKLGWPLDRIIHAEIWATDTIPADLPPMVEFKAKADEIIKRRWGISVEHVCAVSQDGTKQTYEKIFYRDPQRKKTDGFESGSISGFPYQKGAWCNDRLKTDILDGLSIATSPPQKIIYGFPMRKGNWCTSDLKRAAIEAFSRGPKPQGAKTNTAVQYVGIALDEPKRLERLEGTNKISPLATIGWTEADCRRWCEENNLLSPIYTTATRGGCWFCHNQGLDQLRQLRHNYPDLWSLLLKWDSDSPVTFKAGKHLPDGTYEPGHTVHDYDVRFCAEDLGLVPQDRKFRWGMLTGDVKIKIIIFQKQQIILKILEENSYEHNQTG